VRFFGELGELVSVLYKQGHYFEIFPYSELVINQTVKGDMNFRIFESMMCGACLLTEEGGNGLTDLFTPGEHLLTYRRNDAADAATKITEALADTSRTRALARQGRDEVLRAHTSRHRAARILEILSTLEKKTLHMKRFCWATNFSVLSSRLRKLDSSYARQSLVYCLRVVESALQHGETLIDEVAMYVVHACCTYDRELQATAGMRLLDKLVEAYPNISIVKVAAVRAALNRGEYDRAERFARELSADIPQNTYRKVETAMTVLLKDVEERLAE